MENKHTGHHIDHDIEEEQEEGDEGVDDGLAVNSHYSGNLPVMVMVGNCR